MPTGAPPFVGAAAGLGLGGGGDGRFGGWVAVMGVVVVWWL